jgi:hypothetical protein
MSKLIKIMAGLAFASVGLAAPAHADAKQDQEFYRLLTEPDQDHPMVIWNFVGVGLQGIAACQREDAGETPYQALKDLQSDGPYTFDDAMSITTAAETIYCPWHNSGPSTPNPAGISAPVYPPPIYPPQAWYPERSPEMPPPGAGPNW